jgi:protein TonB
MSKVDDSFLDEDVPVTLPPNAPPPPPPPPPPPAPEVIKVVEDNKKIEEKIIESTETNQEAVVEKPVVQAKQVEVVEEEEEVDVPFAIIEDIPVYPGCEKEKTKETKMSCMNKKFNEYFAKNFNYPEAAKEAGIQGRSIVSFRIEKDGTINVINVRAPHPSIETEIKRAFTKLPKMTPGKQRGKAVSVPYSMPFNLKLD